MHDYLFDLSKAKSSDFHYFVLSIGTVRGKPMTASGRPRKSHISTLIQYTTLWLIGCALLIRLMQPAAGHEMLNQANSRPSVLYLWVRENHEL